MHTELQLIGVILVYLKLIYQSQAQMYTMEIPAIREKLKEFNRRSEIATNVYIYRSEEVNISDYIISEMPVILVNRMQSNFKLIYQLNQINTLAIVLFSERHSYELLNMINVLLTRLRQLKLLFILPTILSDEKPQLSIFRWAWQSGYTRIMSLYATTLANGTQIRLMSYTPFPELHLVRVVRPEDYFRRRLPHDFQGHPIRTPLGENAPIAFSYKDRYGEKKRSGLMYNIFRNFIQLHNATVEEVVLPKPYPELIQMESVIAALQSDKLDISLHLYFADYEKWHINQPPFSFPHFFRVPNAKPRPFSDYIWAPFQFKLWFVILHYLFLIALLLTIGNFVSTRIERLHKAPKRLHIERVSGEITTKLKRTPNSRNYYTQLRHEMFESLRIFIDTFLHLVALLCFTANSYCQRSKSNFRLNLVNTFHSVLAFILVNYYSAQIVSFLTTGIYEPQLRTIADVINSPFKIQLTLADIPYFANDWELRRKVAIVGGEEMWRNHVTLNDSVILLNTRWFYDFFSSQQINLHQKRVRLLQTEIIWDPICGMQMPLNSPYVEMVNDMMLWSFNAGLFSKEYFNTRWAGFDAGILRKLPSDYEFYFALDIHYFYWAWWVCFAGYVLSAGVLLIERFWHKRTK